MSEWWNALTLAQQIFYGIAIIATLVLVVQVVLGLIGLDHPTDIDIDAATDHGSGLGVLSIQSLATFFVGFGWIGGLWLSRGHGLVIATVSGTIIGVTLMAGMVFLMRWILRLQDSGTLDYQNAVGLTGTVYVIVPPTRAPGGQVEVLFQGRTVFADALTDSAEPLKTGSRIRVVSVVAPTILVVEPA
jgi:hypothetical protein